MQKSLLELSFTMVFLVSLADLNTIEIHCVCYLEHPPEKWKEKKKGGEQETTVHYKSTRITLKYFVTIKHLWVIHQLLDLLLY